MSFFKLIKKLKNATLCLKEKKTNPQTTIDDATSNSRKKEKSTQDASIFRESIFEGNKWKQVNGRSLLASSLEVIVVKLKKR